ELLQAGPPTYTINAAALDYMRVRGATPGPIEVLRSAGPACFHDETAWTAHAASLGITANTGSAVDPLRIATEGALWGSIDEQGLLADTVILSDGARQFRLGQHAQCWVHAERLIHKLEGFCDWQRQGLQRIRRRVWWLYADLKAYCHDPTPRRRTQLKQRVLCQNRRNSVAALVKRITFAGRTPMPAKGDPQRGQGRAMRILA